MTFQGQSNWIYELIGIVAKEEDTHSGYLKDREKKGWKQFKNKEAKSLN